MKLLSALVPHLFALCRSYPIESAEYFVEKLSLMHKNLKRGLATGALEPDARTWPGLSELVFLRVTGIIWPTSDMHHPVISPARLLIGAYLGLCRVRSFGDIASGLFLSSLFLQYESLSKRFVPEAINFAVNATLHLVSHVFASAKSLPGVLTCPDLRSALCEPLVIDAIQAKGLGFRKPDLLCMISSANPTEQSKIDALGVALGLLDRFSDMYKSLDGFIELYEPINLVLLGLECGPLSEDVQVWSRFSVNCTLLHALTVTCHLLARKNCTLTQVCPAVPETASLTSSQTDPNPDVYPQVRNQLVIVYPATGPGS